MGRVGAIFARIRAKLAHFFARSGIFAVMIGTPDPVDDDLVYRIAASTGLSTGVARRIVDDVLAHRSEAVEDYVARRHRELAAAGLKNPDIYERLRAEIAERLFKGPSCTTRQIRRMIYG